MIRYNAVVSVAAVISIIAAVHSTLAFFTPPPPSAFGPINGANGKVFPSVDVPRAAAPPDPLQSKIVKTFIDGKWHFRWDQQFRSAGYHSLMHTIGSQLPDGVSQNRLQYITLLDSAFQLIGQHDERFQMPTTLPPNGAIHGLAFGSRLPINLFASVPGDFLDPSPTLGGTAVPLLPPGADGAATGWKGLNRPTLNGAVDLVTGVPLARVVDLELPFDGATFRVVRTRSASRHGNDMANEDAQIIGDDWWDWAGLGWMTGENPLLLVDSCIPDMSHRANRTTWLVLDAFHSIPFQFIESAGQYEAPPRFRATLMHDGAWGTFQDGERGWRRRPQQYTVSLYDGMLHYTFVAIQNGGIALEPSASATVRANAAIADLEDVPPHLWDTQYSQLPPSGIESLELRSLAERWILLPPQSNEHRNPYLAKENRGLGLPTLGLCTRIEDNYGHIVEMNYAPVTQTNLRDTSPMIDNQPPGNPPEVPPGDGKDDRAQHSDFTEVFQDTFRRGQLHYIELKKKNGTGPEQVRWTLLYAHRRFEGTGGEFRDSSIRVGESAAGNWAEWLRPWLAKPAAGEDPYASIRDDLECYDGSLAIEAIYAFEGDVQGIASIPLLTVSQRKKYPVVEGSVVLDGSDDPIADHNTDPPPNTQLVPTNWKHRVRHFYRYDTLTTIQGEGNRRLYCPLGAPVLIKTLVQTREDPQDTNTQTISRNTAYQYSAQTDGQPGNPVTPIQMRVDSSTTPDPTGLNPWSERGSPPWLWLDRIYTDDDISRIRSWGVENSQGPIQAIGQAAAALGVDEIAAHWKANAPSNFWSSIYPLASISWEQFPVGDTFWSSSASSARYPAFTSLSSAGFIDNINLNHSHQYGGDNCAGTVSRLVMRSNDKELAYQINRATQGPFGSERAATCLPGFMPVVIGYGAPGHQSMRSRFVSPYQWTAYPAYGSAGEVCWDQPPDLEMARWISLIDQYDSRSSLEANISYSNGEPGNNAEITLRPGMVSRQVIDLNPSGVTIRDRSWNIATGQQTTVQNGFTKTYKYALANELFSSQIDALASSIPSEAREAYFAAFRREMLLVEERSFGWSAVPEGSRDEKGLIVFHEYDFTPFMIEVSSPDPDTNQPKYTPAVPLSSFIQCNRHGIKRGVNGTKYYTSQVFRADPGLKRPTQIEWQIEFLAPRTAALTSAPTNTLSDPEYRVTRYVTEYRETEGVPPSQQKIKMTKTIGPGRNLYPAPNSSGSAPLYFPVEAQWFDENGQANWTCSGLVRDPISLTAHGSDVFESLIFSHSKFENNRLTSSIEDVNGDETVPASTPGSSLGDITYLSIDPLPGQGLSRIPSSTIIPALRRATVYDYNLIGGGLSDIWYPDGRRFAKRVFNFDSSSPVPEGAKYKEYTTRGWRETFTFNDLEWDSQANAWKCLKPGQWNLSANPAQAAGMSSDGVRAAMWEPLPAVSLTVDFGPIETPWLSHNSSANLSHIALPTGVPGRTHLPFTDPFTLGVLTETKYGLDGNGRLARLDTLERDPTGVFLSVGTKEVNDLVDVLRERDIDGTITRTTRDFFGHPLRKYVGTDDFSAMVTQRNMVMLERQEYGEGETNAWLPTVHRRYTNVPTNSVFTDPYGEIDPQVDDVGIPTVTSYDWRMRPVRVDSYARGVYNPPATPRRLSTKLTYLDHAGRTCWEVTYGADPETGSGLSIPDSLDPSKLGAAGSGAQLMPSSAADFFAFIIKPTSLVQNLFAADGSIQETRTYDVATTTGTAYQSAFTYKGIGGQEVYAQRPGQPIQIQVLHPAGHLLSTISVRPDAAAVDPSSRYELSRTDLVYDDQLNVVERLSYERSVYDSANELSASNAVISCQWSWYDRAKRLIATADFGAESISALRPTAPPSDTGSLSSISSSVQVNLFEYNTAGQQVASIAPNGKRTEKTYTGTGKVATVTEDAGPSSTALNRKTTYEYKWGRLAAMIFDRQHGATEKTQTTRLWFSEGNGSNNGLGVDGTTVVDDNFAEVSENGSYIGKVWFPHRQTGLAGEGGEYPEDPEDFRFKYNFAGQIAERIDSRGVVFRYSYDDLGRLALITVGHYSGNTYASGYPAAMDCPTGSPQDRITKVLFGYDDRGNQIKVTAYCGTSIVTQNQFDYSNRDDLVREYQSFGGAVVASGTDPTPAIDYSWSYQATNGTTQVGHHRLTSMTYPAQPNVMQRRVVNFTYGSSSGTASPSDIINDKLSRITSMTTTPGVFTAENNIADFDWSGTGRRVKHSMGAGRIVRDSRAASSDTGYTNLDHFGRMKDFAFRGGVSGSTGFSTILYRAQYGYDAVGNRTSSVVSEWTGSGTFTTNQDSVESLYDALNRLTGTKSGVMANSAVANPSRADAWNLDLLGNWVGNATVPGRTSTRDLGNNTFETRSFTHSINERNELTFVDSDASVGGGGNPNPPPAADSQTIYDQSGNLVFDGTYFYQYDAWGRLIQINTAALSSGNVNPLAPTPDPTPCPAQEFTIGAMIKHFTYDGLGRLIRVQSPWPSATTANGGVRSERFYYDGARRIQERVTDPLASVELIETPEGGENNPELEQLLNQTNPGGTPGGDGSANPLNFESGQLNEPGPIIGSGGEPLPVPLSGLEREYVWGPGDNGLDEILVQYDLERKAFWMIQDGGGDVVAMCDLAGSGGTARVVKSWQYDAYGQCLRATDVVAATGNYSIPMNRIGHKGLFMDRLDVSAADPGTYADNPRLAPFSTVLYQNRNRTYSPQLGRFIQRDPNESGQLLAAMQGYHGSRASIVDASFSLLQMYSGGGHLGAYLSSSPLLGQDPMGLFDFSIVSLLGASTTVEDLYADWAQDVLSAGESIRAFSVDRFSDQMFEQAGDFDWAFDWSQADDAYSRTRPIRVDSAASETQSGGHIVAGWSPGHHMGTIRNLSGGLQWTRQFTGLFRKHGIKPKQLDCSRLIEILDLARNRITDKEWLKKFHDGKGPHALGYHEWVMRIFKRHLHGKKGKEAGEALMRAMDELRDELMKNGDLLRNGPWPK